MTSFFVLSPCCCMSKYCYFIMRQELLSFFILFYSCSPHLHPCFFFFFSFLLCSLLIKMEILEKSSSGILPGESPIVITMLYIDIQLSSVRQEPNKERPAPSPLGIAPGVPFCLFPEKIERFSFLQTHAQPSAPFSLLLEASASAVEVMAWPTRFVGRSQNV